MRVAVILHKKNALHESSICDILRQANADDICESDLLSIIASIENPSTFPESWARAVFEVALIKANLDIPTLVDFWEKLASGRSHKLWLYLESEVEGQWLRSFVAELILRSSEACINLAVDFIQESNDSWPDLSADLNRRAASGLRAENISTTRLNSLINCLTFTKPTFEEAQLYGDIKYLKKLFPKENNNIERIAARINLLPQAIESDKISLLRDHLIRLVSNRTELPVEISVSALDAIIQIDTSTCGTLVESDWRQPA